MDILDILLDILLKPPQPLMGLFFYIKYFISGATKYGKIAQQNHQTKIQT